MRRSSMSAKLAAPAAAMTLLASGCAGEAALPTEITSAAIRCTQDDSPYARTIYPEEPLLADAAFMDALLIQDRNLQERVCNQAVVIGKALLARYQEGDVRVIRTDKKLPFRTQITLALQSFPSMDGLSAEYTVDEQSGELYFDSATAVSAHNGVTNEVDLRPSPREVAEEHGLELQPAWRLNVAQRPGSGQLETVFETDYPPFGSQFSDEPYPLIASREACDEHFARADREMTQVDHIVNSLNE